VVPDSIQLDTANKVVTAQLQDTAWSLRKPLQLSVHLLKNSVVRVKVTEAEPLHGRYEVRDVLMQDGLVSGQGSISRADDGTITVAFGNEAHKLVVSAAPKPFAIELFVNGKSAMRANSQSLMNFEPYREKNPRPDGVEGEADPSTSAHPYDEDGMWEENFGSHKDTKPRGPADVALDVEFVGSSHIYGIPEHASDMALESTNGDQKKFSEPFRLYNLDVFEYELNEPMALYGAIPFVMSHTKEHTVGFLWLNAAETFVDVYSTSTGRLTHWISESGIIDAFFFVGPKPRDVSFQYAELTGFPMMPQQFSIAYHQCRWNYKSEQDVAQVDAGFDEHDIPYDVLWLDIEHTDGKKYFTWDSNHFPNPKTMQDNIAAKKRKMVTIVDPHIKRQSGYYVHEESKSKGLYVKNKDGGDFDGWCWPGSSSWLDFCRADVREYWAGLFALDKYQGSTPNLYTWNDMNEPSVFNGPEVSMPRDNLHMEGAVEHRDVHNQYGFYQHWATADGQIQRDNARPFVLTRSFFAGSQRVGPMWTGDNTAEWSHLRAAQPMLLSLGIAGYPFVGADVGGFFGNPDIELLVRWYQAAAFQPFFRGHAHIDTKRREPWVSGEPYTSQIRDAIRMRYRYLPFMYTTFRESNTTGLPVMRPLFYEYPEDESTYGEENEFLVGSDLLVSPVTSAGVTQQTMYLPGSQPWYNVYTHVSLTGPKTVTVKAPADKIPVYQRGGSIVPRKDRARRSSAAMVNDPFTLVVALDNEGTATGRLYVDDGSSFDFIRGAYIDRTFKFENGRLTASATPGTVASEAFKLSNTIERIMILGSGSKYSSGTIAVQGTTSEATIVTSTPGMSNTIIVRKPNVNVGSDFTIQLQ
jgi:mannosyl-oligosaccharide alpha-1,3-glucosidase